MVACRIAGGAFCDQRQGAADVGAQLGQDVPQVRELARDNPAIAARARETKMLYEEVLAFLMCPRERVCMCLSVGAYMCRCVRAPMYAVVRKPRL